MRERKSHAGDRKYWVFLGIFIVMKNVFANYDVDNLPFENIPLHSLIELEKQQNYVSVSYKIKIDWK